MRIYIDTSVINGLYANEPEIKISTENFFGFVHKTGSMLYSADLIVEEIERTPSDSKRNELKNALSHYEVEFLPITDEIQSIAKLYLAQKVIPAKYMPDAVHIATAVIYNIPVLVSWNFEHIVKLKTKVEIDRINRQNNYPRVTICSPKEV